MRNDLVTASRFQKGLDFRQGEDEARRRMGGAIGLSVGTAYGVGVDVCMRPRGREWNGGSGGWGSEYVSIDMFG